MNIDEAIEELEFWVAMALAAPIIAGQPCIVRRQNPSSIGASGEMSIGLNGIPVIRIEPNLYSKRETLRIYLHELAHIKLHANSMQRSNADTLPARSQEVESISGWEDQADTLAAAWLKYGEMKRDIGQPYAQGVLYALVDYFQNKKGE